MNTSSKIKTRSVAAIILAILTIVPLGIKAQENSDEFGVWTTFEASKKINKKFKFGIDAEFRTFDWLSEVERYSLGASLDYKFSKYIKANVGYSFMYTHKPAETSIKDEILDEEGNTFNEYNIDHDYWVVRNRVYATLSGEYKIGRFEFGMRERVQYTRTNSATTDETKYRYDLGEDPLFSTEDNAWTTTEPEFKEAKDNLTLRSRLSLKYDIPSCKINPFASVELYTRLDEWKGHDKLRYRIGASYKFNKDNSISLYYLYQDANDDDEPGGHAFGLEYSIDL